MVVRIPSGPWDEHLSDIERCEYFEIVGTDPFEESLESSIDHPETHVGDGDIWWKYGCKGFAGVWQPGNRTSLLRLAPIFVSEQHRGQGIGRALVVKRFRYALDRPDIDTIDTYAKNPEFFHQLGFEWQEQYEERGTHYLIYDDA